MSRIIALSARVVVGWILAVPYAGPLEAQRLGPEVARPSGAVADTNDAQAYFDFGEQHFDRDPKAAAAAFYWASRINPGSADAWYARRAAILMTDQGLLTTFIHGGRQARDSKPLRALDSLYLRALNLNPLLDPRLDQRLLRSHFTHAHKILYSSSKAGLTLRKPKARPGDVSPGERDSLEIWLKQAVPEFRGWDRYGNGQLDQALQFYAAEEKSPEFKVGVRMERGRIFALNGQVDNAVAQFQLVLTEMRSSDTKDLLYFYNSKALVEHAIGILLEQESDFAGARDAYGRALREDVAFYPAHQRLGMLALGLHDTTTALRELGLAVHIAGDEPYLRYLYGWALGTAGKYQESSEQLKKAVELEPYFALPLLTLGQVYEQLQDGKNAQAAYTTYLALASQDAPQRQLATTRLREVSEILGSTPPKP